MRLKSRSLITSRTAVALLLCLLAGQATARDYYVNNISGDDLGDGSAKPFRTIMRALRVADKGDRIILTANAEPYRECITLQGGKNSGYSEKPFEIVGNGAVLDGSKPIPPREWKSVSGNVFRYAPSLKSFQQVFLDDKPAERVAVPKGSTSLPKLKALQWCLFDRHIYFCTEKGRIPPSYNLSHTSQTVGVTLYEVRNVVITDLTIQGYQLDGLSAHDSAFDVSLIGITSRGNGRSGISVGGACRVTLEESLIGNNGTAQLRTEGASHTYLVKTDLLNNTAPAVVQKGGSVYEKQNQQ